MNTQLKQLVQKIAVSIALSIGLLATANAAAPTWTVNTSVSKDMTLVASVYVGGRESEGSENILGAFNGVTCIGKIKPMYNPTTQHWLYFLKVHNETNGIVITFKFYDSFKDTVRTLLNTIVFDSDTEVGTGDAAEPINLMTETLSGKSFINFTLPGQQASLIESDTVYCAMATNTLTNLTPTFTVSDGATVKIGNDVQYSGRSTNNYTSNVKYEIKPANASASKTYIVKAVNYLKPIVATVFVDSSDVMNVADTLYAYQNGKLMGKANPVYNAMLKKWRVSFSPNSFKPNGTYNFVYYKNAIHANINIVRTLTYTNLSKVGKEAEPFILSNPELIKNTLLNFSIPEQYGDTKYEGSTIRVIVPRGTVKTALVPTFKTAAGAYLKNGDSVIYSALSAVNFNADVHFNVFNSNATVSNTITVKVVDYRYQVIAAVLIDSLDVMNAADTLYAYTNNFLLGKVNPYKVNYTGKFRFKIPVYSHIAGSQVSFRYYSKSKKNYYDFERKTTVLSDNSEVGSDNEPFVLSNISLTGTAIRTFTIPKQYGLTRYVDNSIWAIAPRGQGIDKSKIVPNMMLEPGAFVKIGDSVQYTTTTPNNYNAAVSMTVFSSEKTASRTYSINVVDYRMKLNASLLLDSAETTKVNENDTLYAYTNGFLMGKAVPTLIPSIKKWRYSFYIYSHTNGATISFKYYLHATNRMYNIPRTLIFRNDTIEGSVNEPYILSNPDLTGNKLISFTIPNQVGLTRYIDTTVWVAMPRDVSRTSLTPQFVVSKGSYLKIADSVQYTGLSAANYSGSSVTLKVLSPDTMQFKKYVVKVVNYRMKLNATVLIDSIETMNTGDTLYAYTNGFLMAKTTPNTIASIKKNRCTFYIYSHTNDGQVEFKYFSKAKNTTYTLDRKLNFVNDTEVATVYEPFILTNPMLTDNKLRTFTIPTQIGETRYVDTTLWVVMPRDNSRTKLTPQFTLSPGAYMKIADSVQYSSITTSSFATSSVTLKVLTPDASKTKLYVAKVVNWRMKLTATAFIDSVEEMSVEDTLYAYTNGFMMSKCVPAPENAIQKNRCSFYVYSHTDSVQIEFRYFSKSRNATITFARQLKFINDTEVGTVYEPFVLSNPELSGVTLKSVAIEGQLGETIHKDSTFILVMSPETDTTQLFIPKFETSPGAVAKVNGEVQYSGISSQKLNKEIVYTLSSPNGLVSKTFVVKLMVNDFVKAKSAVASTVLSPNGDGANDYWILKDAEKYRECTIYVVNSFGQTVFESKGYNNDWNGTYRGMDLPLGAYYYVIKAPNGQIVSGTITIIRK